MGSDDSRNLHDVLAGCGQGEVPAIALDAMREQYPDNWEADLNDAVADGIGRVIFTEHGYYALQLTEEAVRTLRTEYGEMQ